MTHRIPASLALTTLTTLTTLGGCAYDPAGSEEALAQTHDKVVGGQPTDQFLATVSLFDVEKGSFCTGTLVSPTTVVTAAHCFTHPETNFDNIVVVAGIQDAAQATWDHAHQIQSITWHPEYVGGQMQTGDPDGMGPIHDIAVVNLAQPVAGMPYARVLSGDGLDGHVPAGAPIVVHGYGINDLGTGATGQLYIAQTPYVRRTQTEFFAGGTGNPDSCNGDSGGPAYVVVGEELFLVGATSRAGLNATVQCGDGGIYTIVAAYDAFIREASAGAYTGSFTPPGGTPQTPQTPQDPSGGGPGIQGGGATPGSASPDDDDDDDDDDRRGGGGCVTSGADPVSALPAWLLVLGALTSARRRRRGSRG